MRKKTHYVYMLQCPISKKIRYIGCSINPISRLNGHMACLYDSGYKKRTWIYGLKLKNLRPILIIINSGSREQMLIKEYELIRLHKNTVYNTTYALSNRQEILRKYKISWTQFERLIYPSLKKGVDYIKIRSTISYYLKSSLPKIELLINKKIKK